MARIFVIKDTSAFVADPSFRQYSGSVDALACIVLSSIDGLDKFLETGIIKAVSFPAYTEDECRTFIHDYTEFIASLNLRYKETFLWWATDISSKNRYVCPLPDLIQELMEIERGVQSCDGKPVLIVAPSIGIYGALHKAMAKRGRKLLWPGAVQKVFQQRTAGALKCLGRLFLNAARFYARALWARAALQQYARRCLSPQKEFYVIKTFSYPSSWDGKGDYTDPFFGRLPRLLSKDNNVLILSYHWQGYREFIKRVPSEKTLAIFPVEFFLKGSDIFRAISRILTFRLAVPEEVHFKGVDVADVLRFELARTMNGVQVFQLLHYDAVRNMLKQMSIGTFLFTFENNPWERMCMLACHDHSPRTVVVGCQHSVVPQAALNMFVHPLEKDIVPLPSRILTTGEIPKNVIQYYGDYSLVPVQSACALRYEYLSHVKPMPRPEFRGNILLVLDGVEQTRQMLKFVLEQLGGHSRYRLKIRCHPALPWRSLSIKFHGDAGKYANVEISKGALQEDLAWSDMIIYWQTTVVLEAMNLGKPAINFKTKDILSYDPLFQSDALKWTVIQCGNLLDIIAAIEDMDEPSYQKQLGEALAYIQRYFHPVSPESLKLFKFD